MKIKSGDTVQVLTGKDRGLRGKVLVAFPKDDRVLVEGANRVKKHTKQATERARQPDRRHRRDRSPHPRQQRGFVHPKTGKPGRLGYRIDDDGKKVRVCRSGGNEVDV